MVFAAAGGSGFAASANAKGAGAADVAPLGAGAAASAVGAEASPGRSVGIGAVASTCGGAERYGWVAAPPNRLSPALSMKRANASIGDSARAAVAPSTVITIREITHRAIASLRKHRSRARAAPGSDCAITLLKSRENVTLLRRFPSQQ
jgi:hypothetical protein